MHNNTPIRCDGGCRDKEFYEYSHMSSSGRKRCMMLSSSCRTAPHPLFCIPRHTEGSNYVVLHGAQNGFMATYTDATLDGCFMSILRYSAVLQRSHVAPASRTAMAQRRLKAMTAVIRFVCAIERYNTRPTTVY